MLLLLLLLTVTVTIAGAVTVAVTVTVTIVGTITVTVTVTCGVGKPGSKPDKMCQLDKQTGVLISGCADHETSADAEDPGQPGKAYGAMTHALVTVVREHYEKFPSTPLTNR